MEPDWKQIVRQQLATLRLAPERELEIIEEIALHLEAAYEDARADGLSETEAKTHAVQGYDWRWLECELSRAERPLPRRAVAQPLEFVERKGGMRMEALLQHLRFGVRTLRKNPGFTLVVVLTLALGIGANTAIFSLVNAVLLRPVPYLDNPQLMFVEAGNAQRSVETFGGVAPADFWDWQAQSQAFEQLSALVGDGGVTLRGERAERLRGPRVSTNFFDALQAQPLLGRTFRAEDGLAAAPGTVVLSYRVWQSKFGSDPTIIGQLLDDGVQVIGVMPPDFKFPDYAETWVPLARDTGEMQQRRSRYFQAFGRLKAGQSLASGQAEMKTIAARLAAQYPQSNKAITVNLTPMGARRVRDVKQSVLLMLAAVGFVLLIACANVANLLLARAATRQKELAIRAALGATRGELIGLLLVESLLLALAGGAGGLLLATWSKGLLVGLLPASYDYLQLQDAVQMDARVLLFTLGAALLTGLLFGLIPAWRAAQVPVNECLKDGRSNQDGLAGQRTRSALVVAEIALTLVLLVGAGLLLGSFVRLQRVNLGFVPQNLFASNLVMPPPTVSQAARVNRIKEFQTQAATVPGVAEVAVTTGVALPYLSFAFSLTNDAAAPGEHAMYDAISANYFRVMQTPLLAGREFSETDQPNTPPVVIINERLAQRYFAGTDPVGQFLWLNYLEGKIKRQIVGVVKDQVQGNLARIQPQVYVPYTQQTWFSQSLLIRTTADVSSTRRAVETALTKFDPKFVPAQLDTPVETLGKAIAEPKLYTWLLGTLAALSLLLAAVGIYGVMSYSVAQRTHEIGVRMALGAQARDVLRLVVRQGMTLACGGVALGLLAAFALTRLLKTLLFGVSATDPFTFAAIAVLLLFVALLACWLPARRATRVDPLTALRHN